MNTTLKTSMRILAVLCVVGAQLAAQQATAPLTPPKQVPGYVIGANDVLRVTVYANGNNQAEFKGQDYTVQTDGSIALPLIKPIIVAGLTVSAANAAIRKALVDGKQFEECTVDIVMMQYRSSSLRVQGAVRNPGNLEMTADRMNVSDALNKAGGLQPSAGTTIRVRRANGRAAEPGVHVENGWEIYSREDLDTGKLTDVQLFDGDTIDVPVAPKFFVQGYVTTPGEAQWEPNLTLERALIKVGGITKDGARTGVKVRRIDPKTKLYKDMDLGKEKMSFIIEPNDMIEVRKRRM